MKNEEYIKTLENLVERYKKIADGYEEMVKILNKNIDMLIEVHNINKLTE